MAAPRSSELDDTIVADIAEVLAADDIERRAAEQLERRLRNGRVVVFLDLFAVSWDTVRTIFQTEEDSMIDTGSGPSGR
jgi:hypothetical protein